MCAIVFVCMYGRYGRMCACVIYSCLVHVCVFMQVVCVFR